jgi:hypothetical protein
VASKIMPGLRRIHGDVRGPTTRDLEMAEERAADVDNWSGFDQGREFRQQAPGSCVTSPIWNSRVAAMLFSMRRRERAVAPLFAALTRLSARRALAGPCHDPLVAAMAMRSKWFG